MASSPRSAIVTAAQGPLLATLRLSGDKSVSIRRSLFALISEDCVELLNYGTGEDCQTALICLEALGKSIERYVDRIVITGRSLRSNVTLDCRNSGTTARLLMGLLAGRAGEWTIVGDESLSKRPMERVATPLRAMGAHIELSEQGCLPAKIVGQKLVGSDHELNIASAQVKSALLLAGLSASGVTRVREPLNSRNHTELLLGLRQGEDRFWMVDEAMRESARLELSGTVPGDISSAAFWAVAALLVNGSDIIIENVLLNPLRAGWFECLRRAGAKVSAEVQRKLSGEAVGRMQFKFGALSPLYVSKQDVPGLIDEIPALAVLAATIDGESRFEQVGELRVKESDRLQAIADGLTAMGAYVRIQGDDLMIRGGSPLHGAPIATHNDHRIAMSFALAGLAASGQTTVSNSDCVAVSYPEFFHELAKLFPDSLNQNS